MVLGDDPEAYSNRVRDWVANGPAITWAVTPDEVVATSRPRPPAVSEQRRASSWPSTAGGRRGSARRCWPWFERAHTPQPDNITDKRQGYSAWSFGKRPEEMARFAQGPQPGREDEWPFVSDFMADVTDYMPHVADRLRPRS